MLSSLRPLGFASHSSKLWASIAMSGTCFSPKARAPSPFSVPDGPTAECLAAARGHLLVDLVVHVGMLEHGVGNRFNFAQTAKICKSRGAFFNKNSRVALAHFLQSCYKIVAGNLAGLRVRGIPCRRSPAEQQQGKPRNAIMPTSWHNASRSAPTKPWECSAIS